MTGDRLQSLWSESDRHDSQVDRAEINRILETAVRRGWTGIRVNMWLLLVMLVITGVFSGMNLTSAAAAGSGGWFAAHATLTAMTLGFLVLSLRALRESRSLDDPAESLAALVRRQLRFFHTTFEWWLCVWSLTVWMSAFCIVVWVENQEGGYRIGRVPRFTALSMGMIFGTYVLMRLGHYPMVRRSLAALHDLESQITEQTERVQSLHKYWVVGAALVFIALAVTLAWTFRMLLSATN